ncbi:MAG TPA: ABC transporter substrate-binding protein [Ktedonobacterales bacterium]|nr:ABC transporter substrate-binding protein [Ktedonobacterales bacterium]
MGLTSDTVTMDPLKSSALVDREVMLNIYDTLVRVDAQNTVQPDLATSWTYPSPTELDFTLRSDVKFQDGTPFNADAVVFNINRILQAATSPRKSELASVKSVEAVDATHVKFNLKAAFSPLLATLTDRAGMMLSPAVVQATGADIPNNPLKAGSGPFQFKEWTKNDHLTIERNPNYWQKDSAGHTLPYLDAVNYRPITDGNVMATNLSTGTIQVAQGLSPTAVASAKTNPDLIYKQIPGLSFFGIMLNTKAAPLDDMHVRRAISWAVNRDEIVTSVLLNNGVVSQGPVSPSSWAYSSSIAPYSHDVTKAKAELALAANGGANVSFTMLIASGDPTGAQEATFIQSQLKEAGITVDIKPETFTTLLADTDATKPNFQAATLGWSGRPDPDGNMYSWFHTGGGNNSMQYSNSTVDGLLEDARTQSSQSARATDYQNAEKQILDDASYVFINHGVAVQATTKKVHNFQLLPTTIIVLTQVWLA